MSLNHVILGLLNKEPMTGYEMKKIIQNTPFLYWSGNNNQIYKAVVELLDEDYVTKRVEHQDGAPSKNVYTLTGEGLRELNRWLLAETDAPVFRKEIFIKLALSGRLGRSYISGMLASYEEIVSAQAALSDRELAACHLFCGESSGKAFADAICENMMSLYAGELAWIRKLKEQVADLPEEDVDLPQTAEREERGEVPAQTSCQAMEHHGVRYLCLTRSGALFQSERDALDIVALSAGHDANAVILEGDSLSEDFIKLRTGLAGAVLQKFGNYNVRVAVCLRESQRFPAQFRELLRDYGAGRIFQVFANMEDARRWI